MSSAPPVLRLGMEELQALKDLQERALSRVVDVTILADLLKSGEGKFIHMAHMHAQTVELPEGYLVTYSVEDGHKAGRCRHMSMSVLQDSAANRMLPMPTMLVQICRQLGFYEPVSDTTVFWIEDLTDGRQAINAVQPMERQ